MASHWAEYATHKEYTNLQYHTALDDKVRESHAALEGITLPYEDSFWNTAFPPNGWNCRCHVVPVLKEDYPVSDSQTAQQSFEMLSEGSEIFRFNPGKEAVIFPPHHPYYGKQGYKHCKNPHLALSLEDDPSDPCLVYQKIKEAEELNNRDEVRRKLRNEIPTGGITVLLPEGGPENAQLSYQNVKTITGKPNQYSQERNEVLVQLATKSQNVEMVYLGCSDDIKGNKVRGHIKSDKWHYYRVKMRDHYGYMSVRERKGICSFHSIQDESHFDAGKIKYPYNEEKANNK